MIKHFLAFEKQIADLEGKIEELRHLSSGSDINIAEEIGKLQASVSEKLKSTYSQLSPWQKVLVSRHPERPHFQDIIKSLFEDYIPLSGDRNFSDDNALTGGIAFFRGKSLEITVPSISVITGEGGSGGAVALAVANNTLMLEHAIYSVISPEGCSSILWRSSDHADQAAEALKLTAQDMEKFKIIDEIIPEPIGGAHRDPIITIKSIGDVIEKRLKELMVKSKDELLKQKEKKYLEIG